MLEDQHAYRSQMAIAVVRQKTIVSRYLTFFPALTGRFLCGTIVSDPPIAAE
jgi:hypothetical protein